MSIITKDKVMRKNIKRMFVGYTAKYKSLNSQQIKVLISQNLNNPVQD